MGWEIILWDLTLSRFCSIPFLHLECLPHLLLSPMHSHLAPNHLLLGAEIVSLLSTFACTCLSPWLECEYHEDRNWGFFLSLTTCDTEALNKYLLNQWVWGARGYKRGPHTEPWGSGTLITCTGWQWTGTQDKKSRDASFSWLKAPGGRVWLPPCLTPSVTQKEAAHLELSALKWTAQVDLCPQGSRPCWLSQHSWADVLPSGVRLRAPCDYQVERETGQAGGSSFLKVFAWV